MGDLELAEHLHGARNTLERCRKRLFYWDRADTIDTAYDLADDLQAAIFRVTAVATALERRKKSDSVGQAES